jgi:ParB family chromosome partitioning protein
MGGQWIQGGRGQHFFVHPDQVTIIGLDTDDGPEHPLYDERINLPLDESLVLNIAMYGVLNAVKCRKNGDLYEVIDGRQRVRACRVAYKLAEKAGEVPPKLKVEKLHDAEDNQRRAGLFLNAYRYDDSVLDKAKKAARMAAFGDSDEEIAAAMNVQAQTIRLWHRIVELAPAVHKAIEAGKISAHAAGKLYKLSHDDQKKKLKELLAKPNGAKPTADNAQKAVQGKTPTGRTRAILPKAKIRMLCANDKFLDNISDDAKALLRVLQGDEEAVHDIPGLAEALRID